MFDYNNKEIDQFCTDYQLNVLNAYRESSSYVEAGNKIGLTSDSVGSALRKIRSKANKRLASLHDASANSVVPEGYHIKGVSTMVESAQGKPMWVKTCQTTTERHNNTMAALDSLLKDAPVRPKIKKNKSSELSSKLLNQYTFTDYHIGMLAWHREGGDNWNVDIAVRVLKASFADMIERAPKADTCVINQLGDFLHFDSMVPETPTSGHPLDADTRPEKMVEAAIKCMDFLIAESLRNHNKVKVVIAQGNHDLFSSIWLRKMFSYMYKDNNRVEFIESAAPFYAFTWGVQMLGYHHGHKVKFASLPSLFMDQFRDMYGATKKTAIHMGHYHHQEIKEVGTSVVEMHRTLAARDAHASYGGYHSERASDVITYHQDYGEVSRATVRPLLFGDC